MLLKIVQFNLENLFSRYALLDRPQDYSSAHVGITGIVNIDYNGRPLSDATTQAQRNNTAQAILDCEPDVLAVEEVENLWTLRCFNDQYLGGYFGTMVLIEGNDARGIDVALCLKHGLPVTVGGIRSHADEVSPGTSKVSRYYDEVHSEMAVIGNLFSRDCLEVDIDAGSEKLTFLLNHFKAQASGSAEKPANTLRKNQADRVAQLASDVWTKNRKPIIIGDLNEDWNPNVPNPKVSLSALKALVDQGKLADPFVNTQEPYPWTHFYAVDDVVSRLDYILPDSSLRVSAHSIFRKGITLRCLNSLAGDRYPTMGQVGTEASDHCPVTVIIDVGGA